MPPPGKFKGCGRGIFALESWDPPARPADLEEKFAQMQCNSENGKCKVKDETASNSTKSSNPSSQEQSSHQVKNTQKSGTNGNNNTPADMPKPGQKMMAKYNYKANPASPLGGPELTIQQGEHLTFVEVHDSHWWVAENTSGNKGYVPCSYVMPVEERVSSLPWLKNKEPEPENRFGAPADVKPVVKPYIPSYKHEGLKDPKEVQVKQYFCEVCQKQLNGPMPYKAHMASKAHKEEVEIAAQYNS